MDLPSRNPLSLSPFVPQSLHFDRPGLSGLSGSSLLLPIALLDEPFAFPDPLVGRVRPPDLARGELPATFELRKGLVKSSLLLEGEPEIAVRERGVGQCIVD